MTTFAPLLADQGFRRIAEALHKAGGEARLVGGCLREALLQTQALADLDIAASLPPDRVGQALTEAGIKAVPTGLAHGTWTAVVDGKGYEITSLRKDVATDGRHATVAFTDDWQADAARRDFTVNALYLDPQGNLYDYFNSQDDIATRTLRFIGDPAARIDEDVLRILRAFRFIAQMSPQHIDPALLEACRLKAPLIPTLSQERIGHEVKKLLATPAPLAAWTLLQDYAVLPYVLPSATHTVTLAALQKTEALWKAPPHFERRLAALLTDSDVDNAAAFLKLSNKERHALTSLFRTRALLASAPLTAPLVRQSLYREGALATGDALLLLNAPPSFQEALAAWNNPRFPLSGNDALRLGITPGPEIGKSLKETEAWWIAADFTPSREACLAELRRKLGFS